MCGIIGYCGPKPATEVILEGLKRLEYRGYDSAGLSIGNKGQLNVVKKKGKIADLRKAVPQEFPGSWGIGHTRWATHGEVNDVNAHPHMDASGKIAVVHNGIIENYAVLQEKLKGEGVQFRSQTDSEVIVHLIASFYKGDLQKAVKQALGLLRGTYGVLVMHVDHPDEIIGARNGSPLVLGIGEGEVFFASDVTAILGHTKQVVYLEDGEVAYINRDGYHTTDLRDNVIDKQVETVGWELEEIEKGSFSHFMLKEIFEQPASILRAMQGRIEHENATAHLGGLNLDRKELFDIERVRIVASGTSYYAGMVGAYILEQLARIPCVAELSSELRYRNPVIERNTLYFVVSQSGETADTLYAMRELQRKGAKVLGICNVVGSTIPRESDGGVYI
ncbi:MAG: glutamine--fructose-6-phosphate transaminase (isomerizing), partial [Spirochaetaceae bacterium]